MTARIGGKGEGMRNKVTEIKREIRSLERLMRDMEFNVLTAHESLSKYGVMIEVLVADGNGKVVPTRTINPAFKIREDAMAALKILGKQLEPLRSAVRSFEPQDEEFKI